MVVAAMKHMASNFAKLDKFEGMDFRRWQKKMHFLLSSMSVVYVLTTLIPEDGENATIEQIRRRNKMLNLPKNYEIPWRPNIWVRMHQVSCIIDNLPPSKKDFKHTLKQKNEELTLVELGNHLRIEESLKMHDSDKPKGNNFAGPLVVNMVEHKNSIRYNDNKGKRKHQGTKADPNKKYKVTCWKCGKPRHLKKDCKGGKVGNKANGSAFMSTSKLNDSILWHARLGMSTLRGCKICLILELIHSDLCDLHATPTLGNKKYFVTFIDDASRTKSRVLGAVVRLPDPKLKTLGERGIECIFVGYAEHSKAFRFCVIEPNESISINSIIKSRDAIFDENRLSSVPRPSQRSLINGTKHIGGSVVLEEVTKECFNVEDDPKTFDEAMKSHDVAFWKDVINDDIDSIMGNNTWVLADLPPVSTPMDTSVKLMLNNGQAVSQLEYSRVIGCLMYVMTFISPDIAFAVGKLSSNYGVLGED
ncbi:zinc finger, CCHC-type containing protein [Tanacetum coccineum]